MEEVCSQGHRPESKCLFNETAFNYKFVEDRHVLYCAIEKTGSTFWKRILHVIGKWGNTNNPMEIKASAADNNDGGFQTLTEKTVAEVENIFDISTSIMFVRDPFTRAFSAWFDKFYSPNVPYWITTGSSIKQHRLYTDPKAKSTCGYDISFREFINFLVTTVPHRCSDRHFSPNSEHCSQCQFPFKYIGKYETLEEDTYFLLQTLGLTQKVVFTDFNNGAIYDTIRGMSDWVFEQKHQFEKCNVTLRCALFRLWKQLQGRGLLSKHVRFPYQHDHEVQRLTANDLIQDLYFAHRLSNTTEIKNNRKEALIQAFKSVPEELLQQFIKIYQLDFDMFEYEVNPMYLRKRSSVVTDFDYFEEC